MILVFSGDPFLAHRAAKRALHARGLRGSDVHELNTELTADLLVQVASQSGLFGTVGLLLDFDAAFKGKAGVKPRNDVIKVLETLPEDNVIVIVDLAATSSRQKTYRKLGDYTELATPRFNALTHWIRQELEGVSLSFDKDVPQTISDLFGEDLPGVASEINKLAILDEHLSSDRVREIVNRPAARDAFDLIEAITKADKPKALAICQSLHAQGEAPPRVLGALTWQYNLVAHCVALTESRAKVTDADVARTLKVKPFVARKALGIARKLTEARLRLVLTRLLEADIAMKTGAEPTWALESLALSLASLR
jgi:DNA polymerase-3 subunit delta